MHASLLFLPVNRLIPSGRIAFSVSYDSSQNRVSPALFESPVTMNMHAKGEGKQARVRATSFPHNYSHPSDWLIRNVPPTFVIQQVTRARGYTWNILTLYLLLFHVLVIVLVRGNARPNIRAELCELFGFISDVRMFGASKPKPGGGKKARKSCWLLFGNSRIKNARTVAYATR